MSRTLLRSVLELRASPATKPSTSFCTQARRSFNSTAPIIEETSTETAASPVTPAATVTTTASSSSSIPPSSTSTSSATPLDQLPLARPTAKSVHELYPKPDPSAKPQTPISDSVRELLPLLAAQPQHYITCHIHGKPYLVQPGDHIRLPFAMPGVVPGDVLRLDCASLIGSRDFTLKGAPYIDDRLFECRAVVTGSELEPVRIKIKKKQRTRRAQRVRSQHRFTTLAISELKIKPVEEAATAN